MEQAKLEAIDKQKVLSESIKKTEPEKQQAQKDFNNSMKARKNEIDILTAKAEKTEEETKQLSDHTTKYKEMESLIVQENKEKDEASETANTETNTLAADIMKPGQYTIEELQKLKNKTWKELWTDPKYIITLQHMIVDTRAKHSSISDSLLTNGIYGRGTKAGIKTLQEYLNNKYNANLTPDGLAGPATLQALLVMDGDNTRLNNIISDHSSIIPIKPESIKSTTAKVQQGNGGAGATGITAPVVSPVVEGTPNGEPTDEISMRKEILKNPGEYNLIKDKNGEFRPAKGYAREDKTKLTVYKVSENITEMKDKNKNEIINAAQEKITKDLGSYLLKNKIIFSGANKDVYQSYYNEKTKGGKISCESIPRQNNVSKLNIGNYSLSLQTKDYLKKDYDINYSTIVDAIKKDIKNQVDQQKEKKENAELNKKYNILKQYLEKNTFSIDEIYPDKTKQRVLVEAFFKDFDDSRVKLQTNFDSDGRTIIVEFENNNDDIQYGKGIIDIESRINNNNPNKDLLKKDIQYFINKKIQRLHPTYKF